MIVDPALAPREPRAGGGVTVQLSMAGGLTQFGAYLDTLAPGQTTGERHWHSAEDEFLFVTDGVATIHDDGGLHDLRPGDAAVWRAGVADAHRVMNRSAAPCTYLIVGSRIARDICTYPESGRRQVNHDATWEILDASGQRIRGGDLPTHLRNLRPDWTTPPRPGARLRRVVRHDDARTDSATPAQIARLGAYSARLYSDTGGLAQFGAFTETLVPGAYSSDRHWHEAEDEFLYLLSGTATLYEDDGPHALQPGDAVCWPAGAPNAHHVVNSGALPCTYLVVGTRLPSDRVHYAEIDKLYTRENGLVRRTRRDGTPLD